MQSHSSHDVSHHSGERGVWDPSFMMNNSHSSHESSSAPFHPAPIHRLADPMYRQDSNMLDESNLAKKNFVRSHRLLHVIMQVVVATKKETSPSIDTINFFEQYQPGTLDFSLDAFLATQGISNDQMEDDEEDSQEFYVKLEMLKERYYEELNKLNQVCNDFCTKLLLVLRDQSSIRPVSEGEIKNKINSIQYKFDYVRNQLRQNVCTAIVSLQKQYNQNKKKKRALPKRASDVLSTWFYEVRTMFKISFSPVYLAYPRSLSK
jgi:hypothetical protein